MKIRRLCSSVRRLARSLCSLSIVPFCKKGPYDTSRSALLDELSNLKQPLVLCHGRPHFVLDLDERIFCHATLPTTSDTFFVDYDQTDDRTVVFTGSTLDGNAPWEVRITRRVGSTGYLADIVIDSDRYFGRTIR